MKENRGVEFEVCYKNSTALPKNDRTNFIKCHGCFTKNGKKTKQNKQKKTTAFVIFPHWEPLQSFLMNKIIGVFSTDQSYMTIVKRCRVFYKYP